VLNNYLPGYGQITQELENKRYFIEDAFCLIKVDNGKRENILA